MRPTLGWADYRTPLGGLYLCGSGTHPGNGLTGGSGQNAAREILKAPANSASKMSGHADGRRSARSSAVRSASAG